MAVKSDPEEPLFAAPPNDPYLIGVARAVDESLARDHVDPGQLLRAVVGDFKSQRMHKHR